MLVESLEAPRFLVAMPQVVDPFFHRSVVLLLEHSPSGSFGVIINRPLELKVAQVVSELGIEWGGSNDSPVFFGGPVQPNAGITLFGTATPEENDRVKRIIDGVFVANDTETLKELARRPPDDFKLVIGYAGWSGGQLEDELARNDWLIAPAAAGLVFSDEPENTWTRALASIGIRPESLPSMIVRSDEHHDN